MRGEETDERRKKTKFKLDLNMVKEGESSKKNKRQRKENKKESFSMENVKIFNTEEICRIKN